MQLSEGLPLLIRMKDHFGITLIEILMIMIIVVIITAIAVPSFLTFVQERRLTMTAENLFSAMQYARSEAIKRNATVYVNFQTGDNWCYGMNTGSSCNCSTASSCNLGAVQTPQTQQISLSTTGLSSNSVQFESSRGAANTSSGKVTFTLYGQSVSMSLLIGQLGNAQLCSSLSGYQACP